MPDIILPAFTKFPSEAAIIGRLLAGYGELEYDMCQTVGAAIDNRDSVLKAMFRARGEKDRIDIADALGRAAFRTIDLENQFSEAVANTQYCRQIRNKFAHCHWYEDYIDSRRLGFVVLKEIAFDHQPADLGDLTINYVDLPLLQRQEAFFRYSARCLHYLNFESQVRTERMRSNPQQWPKKLERPPFGIPEEE